MIPRIDRRALLQASLMVAAGVPLAAAVHAADGSGAGADIPPSTGLDDDAYFGAPEIDIDEWRDAPQRHRYVHGRFASTDTFFAFYFPPKERWQGRFLHLLEGGAGGSEKVALGAMSGAGSVGFAASCGAYLVESNQGHVGPSFEHFRKYDPSVTAWRASAQTARLGRRLAAAMYGSAPKFGYLFGGSGGGTRCAICMETVDGLWHGSVPYISGPSGMNAASAMMNAMRLLGPKAVTVVDACQPGGSGDPFRGLDGEQREALAVLYRMGIPRGAEPALLGSPGDIAIALAMLTLTEIFDPDYVRDFWSVAGYAGADGELRRHLVDVQANIARVATAGEVAARLAERQDPGLAHLARQVKAIAPATPLAIVLPNLDPAQAVGCRVQVKSGRHAGQERAATVALGDLLLVGTAIGEKPLEALKAGDAVSIDNRGFLAFCYAYRHQIEPTYPSTWSLRSGGTPLYPQRPRTMNTMLAGVGQDGSFHGKMIYVENALDTSAIVTNAIDYDFLVRKHLGSEADSRFRLWINDNAVHGPAPADSTRLIDYSGTIQQALRDVILWVEKGTAPPAGSGFTVDSDGSFSLKPTAAGRRGIQPVVTATADGAARAEVKVGATVSFTAVAEVPAGRIVRAEWDFDGKGTWPQKHAEIDGRQSRLELTAQHRFDTPGIYFPAVRVTAHRAGDLKATDSLVVNLARVRVVVT